METDALNEIVAQMVERYKALLAEKTHNASGALADSVKGKVTISGSKYIVSVDILDYWKFVEKGVNGTENNVGSPYSFSGKMLPTAPIENWIKVKSIVPTAKNGRVPTTKQLAFAIAKSIPRKGFEPSNCLQQAVSENTKAIVQAIAKMFAFEIDKITNFA